MDKLLEYLNLGQYSWGPIATVLSSAFVAGLARGFSGFGASLIFTPLASMSIGPRLAAPLLYVVDLVASVWLIPNAWRNANKREVAVMALGALVGAPIGAYVLDHADSTTIRWMIAATAAPMLILLVSGWRYHGQPRQPITIGVGSISGFLSGLAQIGGPPIVLYWLGGQSHHGRIRANIILFFACTAVFSGISYFALGLFTIETLSLAVLVTPIYGFALWVGLKMFGMVSEKTFRKICYALIALAVFISVPAFDVIR